MLPPKSHPLTASLAVRALAIALLGSTPLVGCLPKPAPLRTGHHQFLSANEDVTLLWEDHVPSPGYWLPAAVGDAVFFFDSENAQLLSFDATQGQVNWQSHLRPGLAGVRRLLADEDGLYALTAADLTSYDPSTGIEEWSTRLGTGHVRIVPALTSESILVIYGDSLLEVARRDGTLLKQQPLGSILWREGTLEIRHENGLLIGVDLPTGAILWRTSTEPFAVDELRPPLRTTSDRLLVTRDDGALCLLDLGSGLYRWCIDGPFLSNPSVDMSSERAYVLQTDFVLAVLDTSDGSISMAVSFPRVGEASDSETGLYGYTTTYANGVITVFFGDTAQLFGLSLFQVSDSDGPTPSQ